MDSNTPEGISINKNLWEYISLFPNNKSAKDDATNELLWNEGSTEDGFKGGDNTLEDDQIPTVLGLLVAPCEVDLLVADKI